MPESLQTTFSCAASVRMCVAHGSSSPARDRRLGEVVDDEDEVIERAHRLDRRRQLRGEREQVVDEAGVGDRPQSRAHVVAAQPPRVGLALHLVADADQSPRSPARPGRRRRPAPSGRPSRRRHRSVRGAASANRSGVSSGTVTVCTTTVDRCRPLRSAGPDPEGAAQRRQRGAVDPGLVTDRQIPQVVVSVNAKHPRFRRAYSA